MLAKEFVVGQTPESPGVGARTPTKSDTQNEPEAFKVLEVFAAGKVTFVGIDGQEVEWPTIQAGWLPYTIRVGMVRVKDTGTTISAADLRGIL